MVFELLLMEHREPRLRSRSPNRRPTTLGLTLTLRFCNASLAVFHPRFHHVQSCVLTTSFSLHHTPFLRPKTLGSPKHRWPTPHHKCTPPHRLEKPIVLCCTHCIRPPTRRVRVLVRTIYPLGVGRTPYRISA